MRETQVMMKAESEDKRCLHGNCPYERLEDHDMCRIHAGAKQLSPTKQLKQTRYDLAETEYLTRLNNRISDKATDPEQHTLRKEIGIVEIMMEERLNTISSNAELIVFQDEIANLIARIESLKKTDLAMAKEKKDLIPLDDVFGLAQQLLSVVTKNLKPLAEKDPEVQAAWERIADEFSEVFDN